MKLELQTARGEPVRDLEITRMTPWPDVVTLGAAAFAYHETLASRVVYRQVFVVTLEGYLPGGGVSPVDTRVERA